MRAGSRQWCNVDSEIKHRERGLESNVFLCRTGRAGRPLPVREAAPGEDCLFNKFNCSHKD